jgi:hypothetical protein
MGSTQRGWEWMLGLLVAVFQPLQFGDGDGVLGKVYCAVLLDPTEVNQGLVLVPLERVAQTDEAAGLRPLSAE